MEIVVSEVNPDYQNWQNCWARILRLKPKLQKMYPNAYLCVAVNSGTYGLGYCSTEDRDGHQAAFKDFERKFGKIVEPTLFLGYKL
jgi:hypothetical protein